ncbi:MAG TPA: hypothetical protein VES20_09725 [Bryobacteraceae bacterium]|nr:hypothetical protein [Bryobacteraceae bacterium]
MSAASKTSFFIVGFSDTAGARTFSFDRVTGDRELERFEVEADLTVCRRHQIRLQELPLLCLAMLEALAQDDRRRSFKYTEEDMCLTATRRAASGAAGTKKRKTPDSDGNGSAWRGSQWQRKNG